MLELKRKFENKLANIQDININIFDNNINISYMDKGLFCYDNFQIKSNTVNLSFFEKINDLTINTKRELEIFIPTMNYLFINHENNTKLNININENKYIKRLKLKNVNINNLNFYDIIKKSNAKTVEIENLYPEDTVIDLSYLNNVKVITLRNLKIENLPNVEKLSDFKIISCKIANKNIKPVINEINNLSIIDSIDFLFLCKNTKKQLNIDTIIIPNTNLAFQNLSSLSLNNVSVNKLNIENVEIFSLKNIININELNVEEIEKCSIDSIYNIQKGNFKDIYELIIRKNNNLDNIYINEEIENILNTILNNNISFEKIKKFRFKFKNKIFDKYFKSFYAYNKKNKLNIILREFLMSNINDLKESLNIEKLLNSKSTKVKINLI